MFAQDDGGYKIVHVLSGQYAVSSTEGTYFSTVLGSCVCACIYDPVAGIGGINHFVLPIGGERAPQEQRYRYGDVAMPGLLSNLCRRGAQRERLMVKLFGGRARNDGSYEPGALNADFALAFVNDNGLKLIESSLGGQVARWVNFHPASGRTKVRETCDSPAFSASRRTVISLSRKSA